MNLSPEEKEILLSRLNLDESELLLMFGKELTSGANFLPNTGELRSLAKDWISNQQDRLSSIICENEKVKILLSKLDSDDSKIELITVLADLISESFASVSPWTVSVLLVKNGLNWICG